MDDKDQDLGEIDVGFSDYFFYVTNLIVSILSLYFSGVVYVSLLFPDVIFGFLNIASSGLGLWYSDDAFIFDLIFQLCWLVFSFGIHVFSYHLFGLFFSELLSTTKGIFNLFTRKAINNFSQERKQGSVTIHLTAFISIITVALFLIEIIFRGNLEVSVIALFTCFFYTGSLYTYARKIFRAVLDGKTIVPNNNDVQIRDGFDLFDPINSRTTIKLTEEILFNQHDVRNHTSMHSFINFTIFLGIISRYLSIFFRYSNSNEYFFQIFYLVIYSIVLIYLSPLMKALHIGIIFKKDTSYHEGNLPFRSGFDLIPKIYLGIFTIFFILFLIWGIFWTSPTKIYSTSEIRYLFQKVNESILPFSSQFCQMKYDSLDIIQISSLPSLMYFLNRARQYNDPLNEIQLNNLKSFNQYIFGGMAREIILDLDTLTQWGIQIKIPFESSKNLSKPYTIVQVYGGYRSPYDWCMFTELIIQRSFTNLIENLIPGFQIAFKSASTILGVIRQYYYSITGATSHAEKTAFQLINSRRTYQPDLIVGQGIGGYFAKVYSKHLTTSHQVFAFESVGVTGTALSTSLSDGKDAASSVTNIFTDTFYSNLEPELDLNYRRKGRESVWKADEAFSSFCISVAQCATSNKFDELCNVVGRDFKEIQEYYSISKRQK